MLKRWLKKLLFMTNIKDFYYSHKSKENLLNSDVDYFINLSAEWLLKAQSKSGDDGYSRLYSALRGKWDSGYIETTGYIIPTFLKLYEVYGDKKYLDSALKAGEWLLKVQNSDGSFSDIDDGNKQVFDTGQCIDGLFEIFNKTGSEKYLDAAVKASNWLAEIQEADGSWVKHAFNDIAHTYYTRVSAAILKVAIKINDLRLHDVVHKNIRWTLSKQQSNGYFLNSSFTNETTPLLHTLIYILEGLLDVYELTGNDEVLGAILKNAENFRARNLNNEIVLLGEYDRDFQPKCTYKCITGISQWAGVSLRLYEITKDSLYLDCAALSIYYLKSKQLQFGENLKGGFYGSEPLSGGYAPYQLVNWNNKFFIDTMLIYKNYGITSSQEQEKWTKYSFAINKEIISYEMMKSDLFYSNYIEKKINELIGKYSKPLTILDLGCGYGKFIRRIRAKFPNIEIIGVDQFVEDNSLNIIEGSAQKIPLNNESCDLVFCIEVMQHLDDVDAALNEVRRVLKKNGIFILCDRDPASLIGILKPLMEKLNLWMYSSDSPFTEKWYSKNLWIKKLSSNRLILKNILGVYTSFRGIPFFNRYLVMESSK